MTLSRHRDGAVVPHQGVGSIHFGMHESDLTKLLGAARRSERTPEGDRWLAYDGIDLHLAADEGFRLTSIELSAPSASTIAGEVWLGMPDPDWLRLLTGLGIRVRRVRRVADEIEWESDDHTLSVYSVGERAVSMMLCVARDGRGDPI